MKTPFTLAEFLEVFKDYNQSVFPMQFVLYLLSAVAIYTVLRPHQNSDKIVSIILSLLWLWMGMVYHIIFFTKINKAAYLFGGLFIFQGILFFIYGIFKNIFTFRFQKDKYEIIGISLIVFSLVIYPIYGYFLGHVYPLSPTFGLPCPTTIWTFGLLLLNIKKTPIIILIIPFIWSIIGFMAAIQFGISEDTGLLVAGLLTTSILIYRNRVLQKVKQNDNSYK